MKVLISGILGKMGRQIVEVALRHGDTVVAGIDATKTNYLGIPVYTDFSGFEAPDVVIDFSSPKNLNNLLYYCTNSIIPAVIGTTALSSEQLRLIADAAKITDIFYSPNMSLGIGLVSAMLKNNLSGWQSAIVETHHGQKKDAPSGTALMLSQLCGTEDVHSLRMGGNVGEHTVILANEFEEIRITHRALSRDAFACGAYFHAQRIALKKRKSR